jgi:hypothetical protein
MNAAASTPASAAAAAAVAAAAEEEARRLRYGTATPFIKSPTQGSGQHVPGQTALSLQRAEIARQERVARTASKYEKPWTSTVRPSSLIYKPPPKPNAAKKLHRKTRKNR